VTFPFTTTSYSSQTTPQTPHSTTQKNHQDQTKKQNKESTNTVLNEEEAGEYVNPKTGERGGPRGLEPTRYGDWEVKGKVTDF